MQTGYQRRTKQPGLLIEHDSATCLFADPFRCRMWAMHDRSEESITDETCRAEIDSFLKHGQLLPVLGRRVSGDSDCDIELIYGARRLFVARHLNRPLAVTLQQMSDKEAFVAMDIENRHRVDISAYERGRSYARWLRAGHFNSQDELAAALQVSSSQVSRLLKIARLPSVIIAAFGSPAAIHERWGLELAEAWSDPLRRTTLANVARRISAQLPRPPARIIYQRLIAIGESKRSLLAARRDTVVKCDGGKVLFRLSRQRQAIVLRLPLRAAAPHVLTEITQLIVKVLQRANAQTLDDAREPLQPLLPGRRSNNLSADRFSVPSRPMAMQVARRASEESITQALDQNHSCVDSGERTTSE